MHQHILFHCSVSLLNRAPITFIQFYFNIFYAFELPRHFRSLTYTRDLTILTSAIVHKSTYSSHFLFWKITNVTYKLYVIIDLSLHFNQFPFAILTSYNVTWPNWTKAYGKSFTSSFQFSLIYNKIMIRCTNISDYPAIPGPCSKTRHLLLPALAISHEHNASKTCSSVYGHNALTFYFMTIMSSTPQSKTIMCHSPAQSMLSL